MRQKEKAATTVAARFTTDTTLFGRKVISFQNIGPDDVTVYDGDPGASGIRVMLLGALQQIAYYVNDDSEPWAKAIADFWVKTTAGTATVIANYV